MRLGIYGGTFDPIHIGHLMSAEMAKEQLNLDKILFIPAKKPPHKLDKRISNADHRMHMIELSIADNPHFELSDLEIIAEDKISYTWITVQNIKKLYDNRLELYLLLGADMFYDLPNWNNIEYIISECNIVVFNRIGEKDIINDNKILNTNIHIVNMPKLEISSTDIRNRILQNKSIRYMTNNQVINYIKENNLYV